jgi:hypothetical protein
LSREKVDMWAKDRLAEMVNVPVSGLAIYLSFLLNI